MGKSIRSWQFIVIDISSRVKTCPKLTYLDMWIDQYIPLLDSVAGFFLVSVSQLIPLGISPTGRLPK